MKFILIILITILIKSLFAQNQPWCETTDHLKEILSKNPQLAEQFKTSRAQLKQYQATAGKQGRAVVTVPVVVHVVHDGDAVGESENISDAQVQSQIDALNRDFRNQNPSTASIPAVFRVLAADFEIEFCLASRDPDGNPTSGINRINAGRTTWDRNQAEAFKPSTIWDRDDYLNIWVMRLGGTNANTLGYAQFPGMADSTDGVVIDYTAFGTIGNVDPDYNRGKTTTHEVGHWLGLFHIWGDDEGACTMDDDVADTPIQASENFGCPGFPKVSCSNGPNGDMFMNYMDYADDACSGMFTIGQKEVADYTLATSRLAISASQGCVPTTVNQRDMAIIDLIFPTGKLCTEVFVPVIRVRNHGGATVTSMLINYQLDGSGLNQYFWSGHIPSLGYDNIYLPELTQAAGQHSIAIYLSSINGGLDQNPGNEDVTINYEIISSGAGAAIPASEGFEGGSLPAGWQLQNPNNDRTWNVTSAAGAGYTYFSAVFDNFSGSAANNPRGKRDGLITPEYDFHASGNIPYITFDVAYARKSNTSKDSLIVYYSADCGFSWRRVFAKGGSSLATAPDSFVAYVPQAGEWRSEEIWLPEMVNQSKVMFRFENYSDYGNNIYIDNFRVNLTAVGIENNSEVSTVLKIVPNPNNGHFSLVVSLDRPEDLLVRLYASSGEVVKEFEAKHVQHWAEIIDLSSFSAGLYLVRVAVSSSIAYQKIIVAQ